MSGVILDRRIIIGLIVSGPYAKKIGQIWDPALVESPEMAKIASWLLDYHEKYGKPPGRDVEQLYLAALGRGEMGKAEAEMIAGILSGVSADALQDGNEVNADFLFDESVEHFRRLALSRHSEILAGLTERGRLDEAEQVARDYRPVCVDAEDSLASITPRPVNWLWPDRIPLGKLTIVAGASDLGKSTILLDISARVSSGADWPDGRRARKRAVLIASAEDDFDDTVVPRLMAAGADLTFCHDVGAEAKHLDDLRVEIDRRVETLHARGQTAGLVIVDPLSSYLGKVDSHNDSQVRVALQPLINVARRHRLALVALRHTRKAGTAGPAMDQVSGGQAFVAAARSAFLVMPDREDDPTRRLFLVLKTNLSKVKTGLAFRIVPADVELHTRLGAVTTSVPRIEWLEETVTTSADDAMQSSRERQQPKIDAVRDWLTDILSNDPLPMRWIEAAAKRAGFSMITVRRAADELGVRKDKTSFNGSWSWSLPTTHQGRRDRGGDTET